MSHLGQWQGLGPRHLGLVRANRKQKTDVFSANTCNQDMAMLTWWHGVCTRTVRGCG